MALSAQLLISSSELVLIIDEHGRGDMNYLLVSSGSVGSNEKFKVNLNFKQSADVVGTNAKSESSSSIIAL